MIQSGSHRLIEFIGIIEDEVPEGWMTVDQISEKTKHGRQAVYKKLMKGLEDGKIIRRKFKASCGDRVMPLMFYRVK